MDIDDSLTARGLTARGLTARGLTQRALAAKLDHRAASTRAVADDLAAAYRQFRDLEVGPDESIRMLGSLQELHAASADVVSRARRELRIMRNPSPRTAYLFGMDLEKHRERILAADGDPLHVRCVYDSEVMKFPRAGDVLLARAEAGEHFRFIADVPISVTVADSAAAVVDLTSYDSSGLGSVMVTDRRAVAALGAIVDSYWRYATPVSVRGEAELDRRSALILSLLAAGATDADIAAQSGISRRTVERTVHALIEQLGATTRFQAGVQAARRGWI